MVRRRTLPLAYTYTRAHTTLRPTGHTASVITPAVDTLTGTAAGRPTLDGPVVQVGVQLKEACQHRRRFWIETVGVLQPPRGATAQPAPPVLSSDRSAKALTSAERGTAEQTEPNPPHNLTHTRAKVRKCGTPRFWCVAVWLGLVVVCGWWSCSYIVRTLGVCLETR